MNEPAITETEKTDLPSPKPGHRKRLALQFVVLVVAVSVLGAANWFTRPPELVWWRSPELAGTGRRLSMLIPSGWTINQVKSRSLTSGRHKDYSFVLELVDQRPEFMRDFVAGPQRSCELEGYLSNERSWERESDNAPIEDVSYGKDWGYGRRFFERPDLSTWAMIVYVRSDKRAFNRTYRQICNSITIE